MSVIRDHMLVGGSISYAHKAAAAAVFELAQRGIVAIQLPTGSEVGVCLTRTAKPADSLLPEQRVLLRAIFGGKAKNGSQVCLATPGQVPIASTLAAYARALLVADGSIRKLRPHRVYYLLNTLFYTGAAAALIAVFVTFNKQFGVLFFAFVVSLIVWAFFTAFAMDLKRKRVFRRRKSNFRYKKLDLLRSSSRYNTYKTDITVHAQQLPYELLWLRHGQPRSVAGGLYDQKPTWCDNHKWFANRAQITAALVQAMETLANSFIGQESISRDIYALHAEAPMSHIELAEKRLEVTSDLDSLNRDFIELYKDIDEWGVGGGDGSGGGDGDGSGGDGGGDGGDGGGDG